MTREEILNMPAGREMDALIARNIMMLEESSASGWWWINGVMDECPDYSFDMSSAWEVLHKFLESHKDYAVHIETVNITTGRLYDVILWGLDSEPTFDARARSAPLAICRAALLTTLED